MNRAIKALIFDVDGTLAETERYGHRFAFNQAFAEAGLDWQWSEELYGDLLAVAGGKERIHYYLRQYHPNYHPLEELELFVARLHATKTEHYRQLLATGAIPLRPGVKRLIKEAEQAGLRLAIATTSALANVLPLLEHTLDPTCFELIAAGDIVPAKKPAPDIYHYVLEQMSLKASECLVFEDSYHGLQAATQAGLKTVVTVNDYTLQQNFAEAILVLNHLGEPDFPFSVMQGIVEDKVYVNLSLIERLLTTSG